MNNKQETAKSNNYSKDNAESNIIVQSDKNWNYQEENNLKKENGYKNMKMKMKYDAPKKTRIIYYNDSEDDSSKKNNFSNNNLNKNKIIMKNIKNLVPFKIPTQKKANERGLKYLKNGQKEQKDENNENENKNGNYEEEFTHKFNGNNPLARKGSIKRKKLHMGIEENPLKSVANKICNIKKDKNENKYIDNNEIIDSDLTYKENNEFENDNINGNEYTGGDDDDDKEQCEENGLEEIGYFNKYEEEEQEKDEEENEKQGEESFEGEKNINEKNNEEDEIVNYDNRNIIKNKYDNKKFNKIKQKENKIKEKNNEKIIKQDNKENKEKEEPNLEIIKIQEKNKIKMQKAQSFLQPNSIPQKIKKIDKIQEIQLKEIAKNNFDSKAYQEKFANSNSISKDLDDKKETQNILTNKNNILKQEKNDKIKSQNKIISKINDKDKNKIRKNDINTYTSSRNKSLNSAKNIPLELILTEKSLNARNKTDEIHFLSSVRTLNNKLKPISSQKLLNYNNKRINYINSNGLNKIEKSHINELRENKEIIKNIKGNNTYDDASSNNKEKDRKMPIKKDEQKRNTNTQHIIMISSKMNYNSKDKDENTYKNKYNNRYNSNTFKSDKINENEIENSGITHSIKYTNKKKKAESNSNLKPHSIIIINSSNSNKEENKKLGREYITSSSILNQSIGYNDRYNPKNNSNRNLGNEYQSNSTSINNNNKVNIIDDINNTNKSLNFNY